MKLFQKRKTWKIADPKINKNHNFCHMLHMELFQTSKHLGHSAQKNQEKAQFLSHAAQGAFSNHKWNDIISMQNSKTLKNNTCCTFLLHCYLRLIPYSHFSELFWMQVKRSGWTLFKRHPTTAQFRENQWQIRELNLQLKQSKNTQY
jgi:hypothetical protein